MRNGRYLSAILIAVALTLIVGCSAANDVLAPSDPPPGTTPISDIDAPSDGSTVGESERANSADLR